MPEWKGRVPLTRSHCERITMHQMTSSFSREKAIHGGFPIIVKKNIKYEERPNFMSPSVERTIEVDCREIERLVLTSCSDDGSCAHTPKDDGWCPSIPEECSHDDSLLRWNFSTMSNHGIETLDMGCSKDGSLIYFTAAVFKRGTMHLFFIEQ
ncbi:hypothetical protein EVAR_82078_1 [Eumeta japonica]|uniref:Uncharacterized protein n=1 Tax=Eumeta variegata TaxID=151549 RepID=A0A4C1U1H5_EUMVA|nr:hypothetical protein EVAR_82078_1 [Eumeta japonica]